MAEQHPRQVQAIGLAWYRRADYQRILEIMVDREKLFLTFDKWQAAAERMEAEQQRVGRRVVRAYIDPEQFVAWCAANHLDVNAKARTRWGSFVAAREVGGEHM